MVQVTANRLWRDIDVRFGGERVRLPIVGRFNFDYESKTFADGGNTRSVCPVRRSGSVVTASAREDPPDTGCRLQSYWRFQYDIDIGGLTELGRRVRAARLMATSVSGLNNIIQTFDIAPGRGRSAEFEVNHRNIRCDSRGGSLSAWEFDFSHDQNVTFSRDIASIMTTTVARLAVSFSVTLSAEVSAQVGGELNIEPLGLGGSGSVSAGSSAGASVELSFRHTFELTMGAETVVELPGGRRRGH